MYSGPHPLSNWRVLGITSGGQGHRLPVRTILTLSLTLQSWDRRAQQGPNLPERAEVGHSQQKKQVVRRRMSPRLVLGPASHVGRFQSRVTCRKGKGESELHRGHRCCTQGADLDGHGLLQSLSEVDGSGHKAPSPSPFQVNGSGWFRSTKFRKEQADPQVTLSPTQAHMLPQAQRVQGISRPLEPYKAPG